MVAVDKLQSIILDEHPSIVSGLINFDSMISAGGYTDLLEVTRILMIEENKQQVLQDNEKITKLLAHIKQQVEPFIDAAYANIEQVKQTQRIEKQMVDNVTNLLLPQIQQVFKQIEAVDALLTDVAAGVTNRQNLRIYFSSDEYEEIKRFDFIIEALNKNIFREI